MVQLDYKLLNIPLQQIKYAIVPVQREIVMSKYKDIVDYLNNEIECENIKYNQKLPTIRELSKKFICSKQTVVHAYEELQRNHIVYSVPQSGYYLVDKKVMHKLSNESVINFSAGSPNESILEYEEFGHCINQAIDRYKAALFNYSAPKGLSGLVTVLKKYFEDYQIFCSLDDIYITSGSQQAINILCSMPFPNGKSNVLVEQPTYKGILKAAETTKTSLLGIERKFDGINFDELERKFANDNIKCFYTIPRFSNPLGLSYSNDEKKEIIRLAEKYDVYIIEDDYLGDLELKSNNYPMYYSDISSRVVYIKSFSKIFLPGLRISAVVIPKILRNTFGKYKRWMDLSTSVLSQGALEIYINSGMFNANRTRIKKIYHQRMLALFEVSKEKQIDDISWHIPDTGFYACIEFLNNINIKRLIKECNKKNIQICNIENNYLDHYCTGDFLPISVGCSDVPEIKNGIREMLKIL